MTTYKLVRTTIFGERIEVHTSLMTSQDQGEGKPPKHYETEPQ